MKKILVVEDEQVLREVYVNMFTKEKFEVYSAANGKEALDCLTKTKLDIIILDILMPVMSGLEFLEKAQIPKRYPKVKVLALSNLSDPKTLKSITKNGATKYVLKSNISPGQLVDTVKELLNS